MAHMTHVGIALGAAGLVVLTASAAPGQNASSSFSMLDGYDLPQGDYRSGILEGRLRGISLTACQRHCATDERCKAFTYNATKRICILKDTVLRPKSFAGAVSGIKLAPASEPDHAGPTGRAAGQQVLPAGPASASRARLALETHPPLMRHVLPLLSLRDNPSLANEKNLLSLAERQIRAEQHTWRAIDAFLEKARRNRSLLTSADIHPQHPTALLEWQGVVDSTPALARALLSNIYLAERPEWSFADSALNLDKRFQYIRDAFVFSRRTIEGRDPEFAARELLPIFRRHLLDIASLAPHALSFNIRLGYRYDFIRSELILGNRRPELLAIKDQVVFGSSAPIDAQASKLLLPDSTRSRRIFEFGRDYALEPERSPRVLSRSIKESAHESWRDSLAYQYAKIPGPQVLALDRSLQIKPIAIPVARAESLKQRGILANLYARIKIDIERIELGTGRNTLGQIVPVPVLIATLAGVDIIGGSGEVVASLAPGDFPTAADLIAAAKDADDAKARAAAEREEAARRHAEQVKTRLASVLEGRTGTLLIRRAGTTKVDTVYTTGGVETISYETHVAERSLDLPARAKASTTRDMAGILRNEPGAAIVVRSELFGSDVFEGVMDLALAVTEFPPKGTPDARSRPVTSLAALLPANAPLVMLSRRGDGQQMKRVFVEQVAHVGFNVNFAGALQSKIFYANEGLKQYGLNRIVRYESGAVGFPLEAESIVLRDVPRVLRDDAKTAVVLTRAGLEAIYPRIADLDLVAVRSPPIEVEFGLAKDRTETAEAVSVAGVKVGMDEAAIDAALAARFAPQEIDRDPGEGIIHGMRGQCEVANMNSPGSLAEVGAYCIVVKLADGKATRILHRQVLAGDAVEGALEALKAQYGRMELSREVRHLERGGMRVLIGYGAVLATDRSTLGRLPALPPPTAIEAVVWRAGGTTTVVLRVDSVQTAFEARAAKNAIFQLEPAPRAGQSVQ